MKHSSWQKTAAALVAGTAWLTISAAATPAPAPAPAPAPVPPPPAAAPAPNAPASLPAPVDPAAAAAAAQAAETVEAQSPAQAPAQAPAQVPPAAKPSPRSGSVETMPDAAALQKLARRALFEATGRRMHVGPVELKEKLADGSWRVWVTLEDGRRVSGRLYRNRKRYHIAVDRRELFAPEQTIQIVK